MKGQTIILGPSNRAAAKAAIDAAPDGICMNLAETTRNNEQNKRMWAMLSDVARAYPDGRRWTTEAWKCAFMHSLGHQVQFCEGLNDSGPFPVGFKTSRLTVKQMADLITVIAEYGDRHGVEWRDPAILAQMEAAR